MQRLAASTRNLLSRKKVSIKTASSLPVPRRIHSAKMVPASPRSRRTAIRSQLLTSLGSRSLHSKNPLIRGQSRSLKGPASLPTRRKVSRSRTSRRPNSRSRILKNPISKNRGSSVTPSPRTVPRSLRSVASKALTSPVKCWSVSRPWKLLAFAQRVLSWV